MRCLLTVLLLSTCFWASGAEGANVGLRELLPSSGEPSARESTGPAARVCVATEWHLWVEEGRSFLSDIERFRFDSSVTVMLPGDCRVSTVIERWQNDFEGAGSYDADGFGLHAEAGLIKDLSLSVGFVSRDNEQREAPDTESYYTELSWSLSETVTLSGSFKRQDELNNLYGLLQGTQSDAYTVRIAGGADVHYELGSELKEYTDFNDTIRILASLSRECEIGAGLLKTSLGVEYRDARWRNYYLIAGDRLAGIIHPYWAPRNYVLSALGCDYVIESDRAGSFAVHTAVTFDTEKDLGLDTRVAWSHSHAFIEGTVYASDEWDTEAYKLGLQFSF